MTLLVVLDNILVNGWSINILSKDDAVLLNLRIELIELQNRKV